jgi:hypothetical protein
VRAFFTLSAIVVVAVQLIACAREVPPEQQKLFSRSDCQFISGNPALEQQFELAKQVCVPRAQAAATTASSNIPMGRGMGGAIAAGIEGGIVEAKVGMNTMMSCMAEQGYLLRTRTEHLEACAAIKEQQLRASAASKVKR